MVVYPFGKWHWLLGTIGVVLLVVTVSPMLIFVPVGDAQPWGAVAGITLALGGAWMVWVMRRAALVLDGRRLGRRSGFIPRIGWWIDLDDVQLVTETSMSSQARIHRRDTVLWTSTEHSPRSSAALRRMELRDHPGELSAVEADVGRLYPFIVQYGSLRRRDADALHEALSQLLPRVPDRRSASALPPFR